MKIWKNVFKMLFNDTHGLLKTSIEIDRTQDRFIRVGEQARLLASARHIFALAQVEVVTQCQRTRNARQTRFVYCRRAQKLGFEVQLEGVWHAPQSVTLFSPQVVKLVSILSNASVHQTPLAMRVRYAYSDWPVVSLRNRIGSLPARIFDVAVESTSDGGSSVGT